MFQDKVDRRKEAKKNADSEKPLRPNRGREVESDEEDSPEKRTAHFKATTSPKTKSPKNTSDPSKILSGVIFALSGFQNPLRGEIRSKALSMGAKYVEDIISAVILTGLLLFLLFYLVPNCPSMASGTCGGSKNNVYIYISFLFIF